MDGAKTRECANGHTLVEARAKGWRVKRSGRVIGQRRAADDSDVADGEQMHGPVARS